MSIFLNRIDSAPIANSNFDVQFLQWLWVLVDVLNGNLGGIQDSFNFLTAQSYTDTEINTLESDGDLSNGVILYDSVNNVYVGRENGVLVKFTTAPYP